MTKILILSGHPRPESFTEHLAKSYQNGAHKAGFETELFKLHELNLSQKAIAQKPTSNDWSPQLTALWEAFERADHVMIAHPLWWGSMPGELKMLFDRLLISGKAYSYQEGKPLPLGHLTWPHGGNYHDVRYTQLVLQIGVQKRANQFDEKSDSKICWTQTKPGSPTSRRCARCRKMTGSAKSEKRSNWVKQRPRH